MTNPNEAYQRILRPLARMLERGIENAHITKSPALDEVLSGLGRGDPQVLEHLPEGLKVSIGRDLGAYLERNFPWGNSSLARARTDLEQGRLEAGVAAACAVMIEHGYASVARPSTPPATVFFSRDAVTVARELCGSSLIYAPEGSAPAGAVATKTAAYGPAKKDKNLSEARAGTVGVWGVRGNNILIISAHEPGDAGKVAVWGLGAVGEKPTLTMSEVGHFLNIGAYEGTVIGENAPLALHVRNTSTDRLGGQYVRPFDASDKGAKAAYELK